ncbi:MAG: hypothetical protein ACRD4H_11855 [Candidatus Acidiferrales bacterium]
MSIKNYKDLLALKEVGRIVRLALQAMAGRVRAGATTAAVLADIGGKVMREIGAQSAPRMESVGALRAYACDHRRRPASADRLE